MATIPFNQYTEEDIKNLFVTPALEHAHWSKQQMHMEYPFTAGEVVIQGRMVRRKAGKRADYLLDAADNYPVAIVEAKSGSHQPDDGLQQAIEYAQVLGLLFAYSSNGQMFVEHDISTGKMRTFPMDTFPTPEELKRRHEEALLQRARLIDTSKTKLLGQSLIADGASLIETPYYSDANTWPPRYYQRLAVNNTIEAIAAGKKKLLLVMATGTGKTYTAFQIIYRLHEWQQQLGRNMKILYLADRNVLIDQTMTQDFKPFSKFMTKVKGKTLEEGYDLYMSLYTQWVKSKDELKPGEEQPYKQFRHDYFDLIVIDECHRSSVDENKQWHDLLLHFDTAIQIGMTATPKQKEGADNVDYFGVPVYQYKLIDGIADGFLAPFRITRTYLDRDLEGYVPQPDEKDVNGLPLDKPIYVRTTFGRELQISARQRVVAHRITRMLKSIGRMTKTIVFCPDQEEALLMRAILVELNRDMVRRNPNYVVRITSDDRAGKMLLDDFINPYAKYPVIATTSELLSTGVDCKTVGLIAIDKEVGNAAMLKQMIGRGTRIFERKNKLMFEILDFRNATQYIDKEFDGNVEPTDWGDPKGDEGIGGNGDEDGDNTPKPDDSETGRERQQKLHVEGGKVSIVHEQVLYMKNDGSGLTTESVIDYTRREVKKHFPTLDVFHGAWRDADRKAAVLAAIENCDELLKAIREENPSLQDYDEFDLICHVAYGAKPLTRRERVEHVRKRDYLNRYQGKARQVLEGLMQKYGEVGISSIEDPVILNLSPFDQIAKRPRIMRGVFSSPEDYEKALRGLENELYNVG